MKLTRALMDALDVPQLETLLDARTKHQRDHARAQGQAQRDCKRLREAIKARTMVKGRG